MEKSRGCWSRRNWSCALKCRSRPRSPAKSPSKRETNQKSSRGPSAANINSIRRWRTTWSSSSGSTSSITTRFRRQRLRLWTRRLLPFPRMQAPPSRDILIAISTEVLHNNCQYPRWSRGYEQTCLLGGNAVMWYSTQMRTSIHGANSINRDILRLFLHALCSQKDSRGISDKREIWDRAFIVRRIYKRAKP